MEEQKTLEEIADDVLSDESVTQAIAEAEPTLPTFKVNQVVNWLGRAATVKSILNEGTVIEIEVTEQHTVRPEDLK